MQKFLFVIFSAALLAACAQEVKRDVKTTSIGMPATTEVIEGKGWKSKTVVYNCHPNNILQVAYLNLKSGESFATLYFQGVLTLMQNRRAASGALYIALDEQKSLRWHTKGDTGFLSFLPADHTATEKILLTDCRAQ